MAAVEDKVQRLGRAQIQWPAFPPVPARQNHGQRHTFLAVDFAQVDQSLAAGSWLFLQHILELSLEASDGCVMQGHEQLNDGGAVDVFDHQGDVWAVRGSRHLTS